MKSLKQMRIFLVLSFIIISFSFPAAAYADSNVKTASGVQTANLASAVRPANTLLQLSHTSLDLTTSGKMMLRAQINGISYSPSWKSLNTSVATVSSEGIVSAVSEGTATIVATLGNLQATCLVTVAKSKILLSRGSLNLWAGYSHTITSYVAGTPGTVQWSVSDPTVASVSQTGTVMAKKGGLTVVTASVNDVSASCTVTVYDPSISLPVTSASLYPEESRILQASVRGRSSYVVWESSDSSVVTVTSAGVITGKAAGNATITASANGVSAQCSIVVTEPALTISLSSLNMQEGETRCLAVASDGKRVTPVWKSLNSPVASIDPDGSVTAKKEGTATITATIYGKTLRCTVTVKNQSRRDRALETYWRYLKKNEGTGQMITSFDLLDIPGYDFPFLLTEFARRTEQLHGEDLNEQQILCYFPGAYRHSGENIAVLKGADTIVGTYSYLRQMGFHSEIWEMPYRHQFYFALTRGSRFLYGISLDTAGNKTALSAEEFVQAVNQMKELGSYFEYDYTVYGISGMFYGGQPFSTIDLDRLQLSGGSGEINPFDPDTVEFHKDQRFIPRYPNTAAGRSIVFH